MPTGSTHVLAPATRAPPWRASASASACSIVAPLHTCTYARARAHTHTHNTPTRAPREHTDSSLKPCDAGAPRPLASHQHRTPAPHMPRHAPVSLTTPGLAHERDGHCCTRTLIERLRLSGESVPTRAHHRGPSSAVRPSGLSHGDATACARIILRAYAANRVPAMR